LIVVLGAALGMLGGLLSASPALAGRGPNWEFVPPEDSIVPASFCGFEVLIHPVAAKQFAKELKVTDGSETILITGTLKLSFTNLNPGGKTINENASSSSTITFNADGSITTVNRGRAPLVLSPADAQQFGLPIVSIVAGRLTLSTNPNETPISLNGHFAVDVCAALS